MKGGEFTMAKNENKNFVNQKVDAVKKWWDSDTTKAISTIIAVLLIPGAVLAWNYASGRNVNNNVDNSILEGESTTVENTDEETTADETATNNSMDETTVTEEPTVEDTPVVANEEEKTDLEIGGINEVTTLPNTSSAE